MNLYRGSRRFSCWREAIVGLRRQPLIDYLMRAGDIAGAAGGFGELQLQRWARAGFINRAIEPPHGERMARRA